MVLLVWRNSILEAFPCIKYPLQSWTGLYVKTYVVQNTAVQVTAVSLARGKPKANGLKNIVQFSL